jgi:hypothetical protein
MGANSLIPARKWTEMKKTTFLERREGESMNMWARRKNQFCFRTQGRGKTMTNGPH